VGERAGVRGKVRGFLTRIFRLSGTLPLWRASLLLFLTAAAALALTRFYASTLVT
jgi:hypothetical protein